MFNIISYHLCHLHITWRVWQGDCDQMVGVTAQPLGRLNKLYRVLRVVASSKIDGYQNLYMRDNK